MNIATGFLTFAAGDCISQVGRKVNEPGFQHEGSMADRFRSLNIDFVRSFKVGCLGVALNAGALSSWYRMLDRKVGSDRTNYKQVAIKMFADQTIYAPFAIASFLSYASVVNGGPADVVLRNAKENLQKSFVPVWISDCCVWPAANFVAFRFISTAYRPSFISLVQVCWQTYMSRVAYTASLQRKQTVTILSRYNTTR